MPRIAYNNFTGGEVSPTLSARYNLERFANFSQAMQNMRPDMRFDPAMPTDMEIGALEGMNEDNQARLEYLNSILDPIVDEENQALSRHEARMEIVAPFVQQMQDAGFSEAQAKAYGTILAANAERMGEVFGMTPKEYLESRLAGYVAMTLDEFKGLGNSTTIVFTDMVIAVRA